MQVEKTNRRSVTPRRKRRRRRLLLNLRLSSFDTYRGTCRERRFVRGSSSDWRRRKRKTPMPRRRRTKRRTKTNKRGGHTQTIHRLSKLLQYERILIHILFRTTTECDGEGNNQITILANPAKIFQISSELGLDIDSFVLNKPTLDDVFISYTGHNLRDGTNGKFNKRKSYNQSRRRGL